MKILAGKAHARVHVWPRCGGGEGFFNMTSRSLKKGQEKAETSALWSSERRTGPVRGRDWPQVDSEEQP